MTPVDSILAEIDRAADEIVQFTVDLDSWQHRTP
jgi:hypothetical protein